MECFQSKWLGVVDQDVEKLAKYRRSKTARTRGHNCSRDFHRWVHRDQRAFDVKISTLKVPIRIKHKRRKWETNHWCEKSWLSSDTLVELVWETDQHFSTVFSWWVWSLPARRKLGWYAIQLLEEFFGCRPTTPSPFENGCWKKKMYSNRPTWRWGDGDWQKFPWWYGRFKVIIPSSGSEQFEYHTATCLHSICLMSFLFLAIWSWCYVWWFSCLWLLPRHSFSTRLLYSLIPSSSYAPGVLYHRLLFSKGMATDFAKMFDDGISSGVPLAQD